MLKAEVASHQEEKKKLQAAILSLNDQLKNTMKKIAQLEASAGSDRDQIAGMASTIKKYQQELQQAQNSIKMSTEELAQNLKLFASLTKDRNDALALVKKYELELNHIVGTVGQQSQRVIVLQKIVNKLVAHIKGLHFKLHRVAESNKNLKRLVREHKAVIVGLKAIIRKQPSEGRFREITRLLRASRQTIANLRRALKRSKVPRPQPESSSSPSDDGDFGRIKIWIHNQLQMLEQQESFAGDAASLSSN